jgi:serine/threonine protein kinase
MTFAGGMGVVYKAEDPVLKRTVALKAILPSLGASETVRKRFLREARTMAQLEHDHVARLYEVGEDRGIPYIAMEFLIGESLDRRLCKERILPLTDVLRIGREIAEGLAAAHARARQSGRWLGAADKPCLPDNQDPPKRTANCRKLLDIAFSDVDNVYSNEFSDITPLFLPGGKYVLGSSLERLRCIEM